MPCIPHLDPKYEPHRHMLSFAEFAMILLIISLHIHGVGVIELHGLSIAPWDWTILILASFWLLSKLASQKKIRINKSLRPALILALIFTMWLGICTLYSPEPMRALTMFFLQIRNLILFVFIGALFSNRISFESLNRKLLVLGFLIAAIAVIMYLAAWFKYEEILLSVSLWKPGIAYNLDQGGALRLMGFAGDPNFYSLWIALPLFISFTKSISIKHIIITTIIGLSVAMAMSRGFIGSVLISTIFLLGSMIILKTRSKEYLSRLTTGASIVAMFIIILNFLIDYDLSQYVRRIQLATDTPRWETWSQLLTNMNEEWNPIGGIGLRGIEAALGGEYSHNSYLDVLVETGLVGFIIWALLLAYVTIVALKKLKRPELQPWIHTWLVLLIMYGAFSLAYTPFPWLLAAILVASDMNSPSDKLYMYEDAVIELRGFHE